MVNKCTANSDGGANLPVREQRKAPLEIQCLQFRGGKGLAMDDTSHQAGSLGRVKSHGSADGGTLTAPPNLSLVPGTRVVERDNQLLQGFL